MDSTVLVLIGIILGVIIAVVILKMSKKPEQNEKNYGILEEKLTQLTEQNKDLRNAIDSKLSETHRANQAHLHQTTNIIQGITGQSAKLISEVTEKLTKLDETNKQVINFSAQLQNLQDILKNPKQRGVLGEYFLEETLKNILPPNSYQMQYSFKDGTIVDAIVKLKDGIVPIDSKFSLENYEKILCSRDQNEREKFEKTFKQDLKNRIDETSKYIKPEEGTMDFAFMFIPSEAIYYDLLVNKIGVVKLNTRDLIGYAFIEKRVIIVSPTTFFAYLQTVLHGLRAMQIEESAKGIRNNVEKLGKHLIAYEEFMKKLGMNIRTTVSCYNNAYKEFGKIDKDVARITERESQISPLVIEKPKIDE